MSQGPEGPACCTRARMDSQWDFADSWISSSQSQLAGKLFNSVGEYPTSFAYSSLCWVQLSQCSPDAAEPITHHGVFLRMGAFAL